jgi:hypothetical protein
MTPGASDVPAISFIASDLRIRRELAFIARRAAYYCASLQLADRQSLSGTVLREPAGVLPPGSRWTGALLIGAPVLATPASGADLSVPEADAMKFGSDSLATALDTSRPCGEIMNPQRRGNAAKDKLRGFEEVGDYRLKGQDVVLVGEIPRQCGVYALVLGQEIVYVGYAWNLCARINAHRRTAARTANYPRRHLIELWRALNERKRVRIFIAMPKPGTFQGHPVNTAIGLEDGLIGDFKPDWNDRRKNPRDLEAMRKRQAALPRKKVATPVKRTAVQ